MVRYGQSEKDQFAFQLDFRAVPKSQLSSAACGFDIWLSVQTQLLDSHPKLEIHHPGTGQWKSQPAMQTCSGPAGDVAVLIHPSDLMQTELMEPAKAKLRLFGNFMEKGVIRRGRVRCLVGETSLSSDQLQNAYSSFAESPLPLTT